ncbi:hypothetical protein [Rhodococcus sp. O3]
MRLWTTDTYTEAATDRVCENAGSAITEEERERFLLGVPYRNPCAGR